jgi:hypothetical protein
MWPRILLLTLLPGAAMAQDAFERQVYDSETAPPGAWGVELHTNRSFGEPTAGANGELPSSGVTRFTLEPHVGGAWWFEAGCYFQTALRPDGEFDFAGVKARMKARTRKWLDGRVGLALNVEVSALPKAYEPQVYGSELRPVADFRSGRLYASVNPILSFAWTGPNAGRPTFEPAAKVGMVLTRRLMVGPEYYGAWGTFGSATSNPPLVHFVYGTLDFTSAWFDLNFGVGYAFNAPERWSVKAILGFHPPQP